ncbi:MAG TPA: quinone-dependent dihydroorotate dehydrogenase [Flavobacteriales bacterium]|nr:quinone-dependent dihydroorotate dehydrogenase [Flavobacteriales bacterium]
MYKLFIKPYLFSLDPEKAHYKALKLHKLALSIPLFNLFFKRKKIHDHQNLQRKAFGITFPNPVGMAAGFDKDAKFMHQLAEMGFGSVEVGTVTPKGQPGNDKPRLFRLKKDEALINRMGFNNEGVDAMVERLKNRPKNIVIGGNIGKNKITPNEDAISDYLICFEKLFPYVDYFVVNVSSPNTPNLRELQDKEPLKALLSAVITANLKKEKPKPVLLKIAPDLTDTQLDDVIDIAKELNLSGIVATNTTIWRGNLKATKEEAEKIGAGGLSGKPLTKRALEVVAYIVKKSEGKIPVIGVGGIHSAADAKAMLKAGACLIQLYSGFVYEGTGLITEINKELSSENQK